MKIIKLLTVAILIFITSNNCFAGNSNVQKNDFLYSEAYFDYLIECASIERQEEIERKKQQEKDAKKEISKEAKAEKQKEKNEINLADNIVNIHEDSASKPETFKLRIQNYVKTAKYKETFKKEDSKVIIPVGERFSFIQNTSTSRNKYSSTDYKILAGAEIQLTKFLKIAGGHETNYRDIDQNPASRKIYITPELKLSNKINMIFPNKYNYSTGSTDYDIGLNISPLKSKAVDFGVYSGITRTSEGKTSQSVNFTTNLYIF